MSWAGSEDHVFRSVRVTCQPSVEPRLKVRSLRSDETGGGPAASKESAAQSSFTYVPRWRLSPHLTSAGKSQPGSDVLVFMKHTIRRSQLNKAAFDCWCWSKAMKEGADDRSDVTVGHSRPWLLLDSQPSVQAWLQNTHTTAALCCTACLLQLLPTREMLFLVICSNIHSGEFCVYPSLENAPTAPHLLTFNARNNSSPRPVSEFLFVLGFRGKPSFSFKGS